MKLVYASDLLGILLTITLLLSGGWRMRIDAQEDRSLLSLLLTALTGCVLDYLCWTIEGMSGPLLRVIAYTANSLLFLLTVIFGPLILTTLTRHIRQKPPALHWKLIAAMCFVEVTLIVVNLFTPIVFSLDQNNSYTREALFWLYIFTEAALMLYGIGIYVFALARGRLLPFFPVWLFFLPLVAASSLQSLFYGVSLIWPGAGIAVAVLIICLQKESIYLDKLTGLYNRYYLDELTRRYKERGRLAALMLDLNDFKAINDLYSHAEGDVALVTFARILSDVVHSRGAVLRFAGDEFIVLLESDEDEAVARCRDELLAALDAYNAASGKPYRLSAAIGGDVFDMQHEDVSDFMNRIDHKMYEDKKEFYRTHDRRGQR